MKPTKRDVKKICDALRAGTSAADVPNTVSLTVIAETIRLQKRCEFSGLLTSDEFADILQAVYLEEVLK